MKKTAVAIGIALAAFSMIGCAQKKTILVQSIDDLAGKTIGCQAGTTGEAYIQENIPDATIRSFKNGIDAALDLKGGGIDAIILDELPAKAIVAANPGLTIVDAQFAVEDYAIAVRKGDAALLASINNTIQRMRSDGSYEALVNAFMPIDGNITVPETIPTEGDTVVRMGTNAAFPPFEYVENAGPIGFDITMSQMIARDYGRQLEVVDMNFDGLIAALQSGAIDFIASGMTANDERRQNVDFSEPYYSSNQVIIVRK
ncbi:MAG: transporter substrate-binding domain-containing protein [Treponema sp.]|nr:transporter substrate-binding domain-containing protein [Treponema sp.]